MTERGIKLLPGRIAPLRLHRLKMTQPELAEALGIKSVRTIWKYENEPEPVMKWGYFVKLAGLLGTTPGQLAEEIAENPEEGWRAPTEAETTNMLVTLDRLDASGRVASSEDKRVTVQLPAGVVSGVVYWTKDMLLTIHAEGKGRKSEVYRLRFRRVQQ